MTPCLEFSPFVRLSCRRATLLHGSVSGAPCAPHRGSGHVWWCGERELGLFFGWAGGNNRRQACTEWVTKRLRFTHVVSARAIWGILSAGLCCNLTYGSDQFPADKYAEEEFSSSCFVLQCCRRKTCVLVCPASCFRCLYTKGPFMAEARVPTAPSTLSPKLQATDPTCVFHVFEG